jgi:probable addiction module antidote protein
LEFKIDYGPGYRVFFIRHGNILDILLCSGDKSTQDKDIQQVFELAHALNEEEKMKNQMITIHLWDATDHQENEEDMVLYLEAALEEKDSALISAVSRDIARANGMGQIAEKTGLRRTSLCKALSPDGHAEFATILKVVDALGLELCVMPVKE